MGEMADWINENGEAEWDSHEQGECDGGCPYCLDPEEQILEDHAKGVKP